MIKPLEFQEKLLYEEHLFAEGQVQESLYAFLMLYSDFPDNVELLNNLGVASYALDELRNAAHYLQKAIEIQPGFQSALNNLER